MLLVKAMMMAQRAGQRHPRGNLSRKPRSLDKLLLRRKRLGGLLVDLHKQHGQGEAQPSFLDPLPSFLAEHGMRSPRWAPSHAKPVVRAPFWTLKRQKTGAPVYWLNTPCPWLLHCHPQNRFSATIPASGLGHILAQCSAPVLA